MNNIRNTSRSPAGLLSFLVTLALLAFIVLPASAFGLIGQDVTAGAVGETVEYPVILDEVPDGLAGFEMTVSLADPGIGEITAVDYPDWVVLPRTGTLPADSVSIRGLDLEKNIQAGSDAIILANLTLRADAAGTTPITITIKAMDDDNGGIMNPAIMDGSFTVAGIVTPAPVADFSADTTGGDVPLTVTFTDLSTGDGISAWAWDFDNDGTTDSTGQNPSYTYATAGTYSVKLVVTGTGGDGETTRTDFITASNPTIPAPVADFSADTTAGDVPLTVTFTDLSTGDGISAWAWDFDNDGTTDSTGQNPSYTYATAGTYSVKLVVTGTGGDGETTKADYITVSQVVIPAPVAGFSADNTNGAEPFTVHFTDTSTGDITGYAWDFDNDGVIDSTGQNPSYTYAHAGTFSVTLNVTGPGGSDDETRIDFITVTPIPVPDAQFTATPTSGVAPLTVGFTDESTGDITAIYWDFTGDLQPDSTEHNPSYTFYDPGMYTIYMAVTGPGGMDYAVKTDYITVLPPAPVAAFSAAPASGDAPLSVQFADESTGAITSWAWDFEHDGTIDSTEQNPAHVYGTAGIYSVDLAVSGPGGFFNTTKAGYIVVTEPLAKPVAGFTADPVQGTAPLTVRFTDASAGDAITSYAWDFENDGIVDSAEENPAHAYTVPGVYTVSLTVTNAAGSDTMMQADLITVTEPAPVAQFTADPLAGSVPLSVTFTDASTGAASYAWDFENDGVTDSTGQNPVHIYGTAGTYTVNLTVANTAGTASEVKTDYITVTPAAPVANFSTNATSGTAPLAVLFTDESTGEGITAWAWDFENDGTVDSTEQNPDYTYTKAGNYSVNLTAANAGGSNTSVRVGYINVSAVPAPVADFSANLTTGYAPLSVQFTDDSRGIGLISWSWDFNNDGTVDSTGQNPVHTYTAPGTYSVALTVKGTGGSITATKTDYISVSAVVPQKPKAEFVATPTYGTAPLTVKFTDKSIGKDITAWAWDFNGDGVTDSSEKNPEYIFTTRGSYNVSLTVSNAGGSSTKFKKNYIKVSQLEKPVADFKADKQSGKAPLTVKFTDKSRGDAITEWNWDFNNDGSIDSTERNPTYTYTAAGKYAVRLVVTNAAGSGMEVKSDYITVKGEQPPLGRKPVAVMFADKTWGTPPLTVRFADRSLNDPTSRVWYFGDGSSSMEENPTHLYAEPGIYFARLYVSNDYGSDQDYRFIFVLPKWLSFWATGPK